MDCRVVVNVVTAWNERTPRGLALNIGVALGAVLLTNLLILLFNPSQMTTPAETYRFEPPGWVIGLVWTLLFAALGLSRWLILGTRVGQTKGADWIVLLLLLCAAYPFYTLGLRSPVMGLIGNAVTCVFALWVANRVRQRSVTAAWLISSVAAWVAFASVLIVEQLRGSSF